MNTPEPRITSEERARLIQLLRDSEAEFLELTRGVTESQWTAKPAPDGWSLQQIAEHLVLGEAVMLVKVDEALASPATADWEELDARKTKFVDRVLPNRSRKATAPAPLDPHSSWTREDATARYRAGRAKTLRVVEEMDLPVKNHWAKHPFPVFDMLNAYQWLLYIPLHNMRHNQQIAETIGDLGA